MSRTAGTDLPAHVLLVHGLWMGSWCWDAVRGRLAQAGVPSSAVDLPLRALEEDVATVRAALDAVAAPVVLVGHSYGGAVITAAGTHPRVARLVYLAAFQLAEGESVSRCCRDEQVPPSDMDAVMRTLVRNGAVVPDPAVIRPLLYDPTVPTATVEADLRRMRPVSTALFRGVPAELAWRQVPSTYVVCAADRTVHPALQRAMARRADEVVEWACDHSPATSRPDDVAALLAGLARSAGQQGTVR